VGDGVQVPRVGNWYGKQSLFGERIAMDESISGRPSWFPLYSRTIKTIPGSFVGFRVAPC
jgi:hypothetical protein